MERYRNRTVRWVVGVIGTKVFHAFSSLGRDKRKKNQNIRQTNSKKKKKKRNRVGINERRVEGFWDVIVGNFPGKEIINYSHNTECSQTVSPVVSRIKALTHLWNNNNEKIRIQTQTFLRSNNNVLQEFKKIVSWDKKQGQRNGKKLNMNHDWSCLFYKYTDGLCCSI